MIWSYAWKGFARRKTRSVLAVSGLAISIALLVAVATISAAVRSAVGEALSAAGADVVVQKVVKPCGWAQVKIAKDLAAIDAAVVDGIGKIDDVRNVTGVLDLWTFPEEEQTAEPHPTVVAGVDPRKKTIGPVRVEKGDVKEGSCCAVTAGRYLISTDDFHAMVTLDYAAAENLKVGDRLFLGPYSFEIVGLLDLKEGARISGAQAFVPLTTAQKMFGRGPVVTTIFVNVRRGKAIPKVKELARELIGPEAAVTTEANIEQTTVELAAVTQKTLFAMSAIVMTVVLLLVAKTALSSVAERVSEIGILKATGWRDSDVSRLLTAESLFAGIFGGLIGCVLGVGLAYLYGTVAKPALPSSFVSYPDCAVTVPPAALPFSAAPSPLVLVAAVAAALAIGSVSGYVASRRAARLEPAQALRQL